MQSDLTLRREGQLQWHLRKLKKNDVFDSVTYHNTCIYPTGSQPARLDSLPKLHKVKDPHSTVPPFRPIVFSKGTYNYNLAQYLCSLLKPHISPEFCATGTFTFAKDIQDADFSDMFMASDDVTSHLVYKYSFIYFATSHTHFLSNSCCYDQVDGVAMGSPLAPVLPNFFMGHYEKLWLNNYTGPKVLYYCRYVDDDNYLLFQKL